MNDKKKEILIEAVRLFKEKGYDNVTVNEIAGVSNISKNTFYYYYDSKEELIRSLFDLSRFDGGKMMAELLKYSDPYEQILCLVDMVTGYFAYLGKEIVRRALVMNLSRDLVFHQKDIPDEKVAAIIAIFKRAAEEQRIRQDIPLDELITTCCMILMGGLQMYATSREEIDLCAIVKRGIKVALK